MHIANAWYIAAWNREIGRSLLSRRICDQPIVLYRLESGKAVALEDICCHRMLPLSHGRLQDDLLVCGYHGLTYESSGRCVSVPSQDEPHPNARVRSYPVAEKHRFIWIWMGEPALADEAAIPDMHWNDNEVWRGDGQVTLFQCDYRLVLDNLLDLTHETYVHGSSIGHALLPKMPFSTHEENDTVTVSRWTMNHEPPPFWAKWMTLGTGYDGPCDRWQIAKFVPPCHMLIEVGVAQAGTGAQQGDRSRGVEAIVIDSITPATETSCWYFWTLLRSFSVDDDALTRAMVSDNSKIFEEDRVILEAQQRSITENPNFRKISINIDQGPMRMRRIIERLSRAEPTV